MHSIWTSFTNLISHSSQGMQLLQGQKDAVGKCIVENITEIFGLEIFMHSDFYGWKR